MLKHKILKFFIFCIFFVEGLFQSSVFANQMIDIKKSACVKIKSKNSSGSGFFITAGGIVATNYHVLGADKKSYVITHDKKGFPIKFILFADPKTDLALLKIDYEPEAVIKIGSFKGVKKNDPIFVIGYPGGSKQQQILEGEISGFLNENNRKDIEITAEIVPGSSGSPILNSKGEVVGVASYGKERRELRFDEKKNQYYVHREILKRYGIRISELVKGLKNKKIRTQKSIYDENNFLQGLNLLNAVEYELSSLIKEYALRYAELETVQKQYYRKRGDGKVALGPKTRQIVYTQDFVNIALKINFLYYFLKEYSIGDFKDLVLKSARNDLMSALNSGASMAEVMAESGLGEQTVSQNKKIQRKVFHYYGNMMGMLVSALRKTVRLNNKYGCKIAVPMVGFDEMSKIYDVFYNKREGLDIRFDFWDGVKRGEWKRAK